MGAGLIAGWAVVAAFAAPVAHARPYLDPADLKHQALTRVDGPDAGALTGTGVAAFDISGNGVANLVVGSPAADPEPLSGGERRHDAGEVDILRSPVPTGRIDLDDPPAGTVRIIGAHPGDMAGMSVADAGDVNGDGLDDLVLGAYEASPQGRPAAGAAYVIYSNLDGLHSIDLARLQPSEGFEIQGAAPADVAGRVVSSAGDVNGDGLSDVLVGAYGADPRGRDHAGAAYVVYGMEKGATVDLADHDGSFWELDGDAPGSTFGRSVAPAGDVNGDGIPDVIVGAPEHGKRVPDGTDFRGAAYVVFGVRGAPATVDTADLGSQGLTLTGFAVHSISGWAVAGVGDQNHDGQDDVAVGAINGAADGRDGSGLVAVVHGRQRGRTVPLSSRTAGGYRILGDNYQDQAGRALAPAGDIDGDGIPDLLVGASGGDANARPRSGYAYVVFGKANKRRVSLGALNKASFRVDGPDHDDRMGDALAAGDVDGDGRPDIVVGAAGASRTGHRSGAVLVLSNPFPPHVRVRLHRRAACRMLRAHGRLPLDVTVNGAARVNLIGRLSAPGGSSETTARTTSSFDLPGTDELHLRVPAELRRELTVKVRAVARHGHGRRGRDTLRRTVRCG